MKHFISRRNFLKAAGVTAAASAMAAAVPQASAGWLTGKDAAVTILYTNDVHTYIDNKSPKLTYAAIAALKQGYVDEGKPVLLVDAGDHIQGTAYGSMDDGATIIELMNEAGYDVATLGNHEFDYGMARAKAIIKEADFPYVSCNWVDLRTGLRVLPAVKLFPAGGKWIAFVGITTPESFTKSTPAYFMNAKQTKYIYDILGGDDGRKLYDAVQKAIDKAKTLGADIIIGLGHLGVDPSSSPWTSEEVIANPTGFDAFIDGHSHTVMENKQVYDAAGKAVTLTQTGSYLANVGKMTLAEDGTITTELISTADVSDAAVAATAATWVKEVDEMLGEQIAVTDINFYISDPATGKRRIRSGETNLGDFVADGIYTYFNEIEQLDCDIAMMNGGGIRTDDKNVWQGSATGTPRVQNVRIYDRKTGTYEPLDPNRTYALAGMNYTLRNLGDGFAMFDGAELIKDYVAEDYLVMSTYAMIFDGATEGMPVLASANSPLASYPGYLLDYEDPHGAGRIQIV